MLFFSNKDVRIGCDVANPDASPRSLMPSIEMGSVLLGRSAYFPLADFVEGCVMAKSGSYAE